MNRTLELFKERKYEIEFYYTILEKLNSPNTKINIINDPLFEQILKSNFLLMLYNLIEACITTGFIEIYEAIENNRNSYIDLTPEFQKIWSDYKISSPPESTAKQSTYRKIVQEILDDVIKNKPIEFDTSSQINFTKNVLRIGGNLDARAIKNLLQKHNITVSDKSEKSRMLIIRQKRNQLAHGEDSFGNSMRDFTILDLKDYKEEVLNFIDSILISMKEYYDNECYLLSAKKAVSKKK